ncbi:hypothetical protein PIB30_017543, partial [Stylosanthes scabra]|nr:hypothetical protein [Stylosanthes scabra]
ELILTWEKGFKNVICETGSLDAFSLIGGGLAFIVEHRDLLSKIRDVELWP